MQQSRKRLTVEQARQKALRYCAYQERCHQEVKNKLYEYGLNSSDADELLSYLITEGFLNEERFAKLFAGGKFRIKHWGRIKIVHALEGKGISKKCIQIGLKDIEEADYQLTLEKLIAEKLEQPETEDRFVLRNKIAQSVIQKGFEPELVWKALKNALPD
ncbi:MAG TPA: regulatory protein RecX [Cyclobacteriaceae bacterium]|nr:RecX family transcriptional regulator [Cyclobacteriaceae bacterium]HMV07829.1 regulatory protein RecX [Cyclobacteriaceae bacterium]HMV88097.1 regulatory protein RecX [Cyclobacteriaceae bacterium]HMW98963.1 regulatory protein RecX [Cyclobacteriaceae bacterium]HMX48403.1 regulatory protein RecX [Cyclobacteriaceae bacterium]